jgi:UTP--glucose-1-phosphate uridylyltransferase
MLLHQQQKIYATAFDGRRYDIGDKLGYVEAIIDFALENDEISNDLKSYLKNCL